MSKKLSFVLVAAVLAAAACSTAAPTDPVGSNAPARADGDVPPDTTKKCGGMLGSGTYVPC